MALSGILPLLSRRREFLLISDHLEQLPAIGAAIERRQSFLAVFYAPLGFAETLVWRVID